MPALIADRFDFPIGTEQERAEYKYPPGKWTNSNPFLNKYDLGYHEALDLNLNYPYHNADKGQFVYACANGEVLFAGRVIVPGHTSWGNLVTILHIMPTGRQVVSRYGHVNNLLVKEGDYVVRGQIFSQVSNAFGRFSDHLHFGICTNVELMRARPWDWPAFNINRVVENYVDPIRFIAKNRIVTTEPPFKATRILVSSTSGLNVRSKPTKYSSQEDYIPKNTPIVVLNEVENGYCPLEDGSRYVLESALDFITNVDGNTKMRTIGDLPRRKLPLLSSTKLGTVKNNSIVEIIGVERNNYTALANKQGWVLSDYLINF